MNSLRRVFCCLLLCVPLVCAAAESSQPDSVENQLNGKLVFLRGMEGGDNLSFDEQGVLIGHDTPVVFGFSALKVEQVNQFPQELEIKGNRVELVFESPAKTRTLNDLKFSRLAKTVDIRIAIDPSHPEMEQAAIHKVFALSAQDALATKSVAEETRALDSIPTIISQLPIPIEQTTYNGAPVYRPGSDVSPPRVVHAVNPYFPRDIGRKGIQGICILALIVDQNGHPDQIQVIRPLNPELDKEAVKAVSQYRFKPALRDGKPVAVLINVEVNFHIY